MQKTIKSLIGKHGGLRAAARSVDISPSYLIRLGNGEKIDPSKETLDKLGLEKVVSYRKKNGVGKSSKKGVV